MTSDTAEKLQSLQIPISQCKFASAVYLCFMFPTFPVAYFAGLFEYISMDVCLAVILALNFVSKMLFSLFVMNAHMCTIDPNLYRLVAEEEANESRRSFLRYVFHKVRVPLHSVCMGLHLLESNELDGDDVETVTMMKNATSFMSDTLNDVLSIQKIEEGKIELLFADFLISDVTTCVQLSLRGQLVDKELKLIIDVQSDVPKCVKGDCFRIQHVLANLLSNAIKFSPMGATITILVECRPPPSLKVRKSPVKEKPDAAQFSQIIFTVIDEGVGISEADQSKLFKPFSQISPGELQQGKGMVCANTYSPIHIQADKNTSRRHDCIHQLFFPVNLRDWRRIVNL